MSDGDAGAQYRFTHLRIGHVLRDMFFRSQDPGPGDPMPRFDLPTTAQTRVRSSDLAAGKPMLLVFGSVTCPVTDSASAGLRALHDEYGGRVRFVMINVREAHPGAAIPQPRDADEKLDHAATLRDLHGFDFEVAVDDLDGSLHRALSPKPNSAYLVGSDGTILFRAHLANASGAIGAALADVTAKRPVRRPKSGGRMLPVMKSLRYMPAVFDRAGKGAWRDMWLVAPPMTAMVAMMKLLRLEASLQPRTASGREAQRPVE